MDSILRWISGLWIAITVQTFLRFIFSGIDPFAAVLSHHVYWLAYASDPGTPPPVHSTDFLGNGDVNLFH